MLADHRHKPSHPEHEEGSTSEDNYTDSEEVSSPRSDDRNKSPGGGTGGGGAKSIKRTNLFSVQARERRTPTKGGLEDDNVSSGGGGGKASKGEKKKERRTLKREKKDKAAAAAVASSAAAGSSSDEQGGGPAAALSNIKMGFSKTILTVRKRSKKKHAQERSESDDGGGGSLSPRSRTVAIATLVAHHHHHSPKATPPARAATMRAPKKSHFHSRTMPELPRPPGELSAGSSQRPESAGNSGGSSSVGEEEPSIGDDNAMSSGMKTSGTHSGSLIITRSESMRQRSGSEIADRRLSRRRHSTNDVISALEVDGDDPDAAIAAAAASYDLERTADTTTQDEGESERAAERGNKSKQGRKKGKPELDLVQVEAATRATGEISASSGFVMTRQHSNVGSWVEYRALFDFVGEADHELSFRKGQRVLVVADEDEVMGWLRARVSGRSGWVPAQFVEKAPESLAFSRDALSRLGKMLPLNHQRHEIERIRDALNAEEASGDTGDSGKQAQSTVCEVCGGGGKQTKLPRSMNEEGINPSEDRVQFLEAISTTLRRMGRLGGKPADLTVAEAKTVLFAQIHRGPTGIVVIKSEENAAQIKLPMSQDEVRSFKRRLIAQIIPSGSAMMSAMSDPPPKRESNVADEVMICFLEEKCSVHKRRRRAVESDLAQARAAIEELRATLGRERVGGEQASQSLLDALVLLEQDLWMAEKVREDRKDDLFEFIRRARVRVEKTEHGASSSEEQSAEGAMLMDLELQAALRARRATDVSVARPPVFRHSMMSARPHYVVPQQQPQSQPQLQPPNFNYGQAAAAQLNAAVAAGRIGAGAGPNDNRPLLQMLEERRRVRRDRELEMKDELIRALQVRWNDERRGLERELAEERQRRMDVEERLERLRREMEEDRRAAANRTWESARKERQERKTREARIAAQGGQESLAADSHFVKIVSMALYNMRYEKDLKDMPLTPVKAKKEKEKDKTASGSGIFVTGFDGRPSLIPQLRAHREQEGDGAGTGSSSGSNVPASPTTVVTMNPLWSMPGGTPGGVSSPSPVISSPVSPLVRRDTENSALARRRDTAYASTSAPSPLHSLPLPLLTLNSNTAQSNATSSLASPSFLDARRYDSLLPLPRRRSTVSSLFSPPSLLTPLPAAAPGLNPSASSSAALLAATTQSPRRGPFMSNISSTQHTLPASPMSMGYPDDGSQSARQSGSGGGGFLSSDVAVIGTVSAAVASGSPMSARRTSFITQMRLPSLIPSISSSSPSSTSSSSSSPSPSITPAPASSAPLSSLLSSSSPAVPISSESAPASPRGLVAPPNTPAPLTPTHERDHRELSGDQAAFVAMNTSGSVSSRQPSPSSAQAGAELSETDQPTSAAATAQTLPAASASSSGAITPTIAITSTASASFPAISAIAEGDEELWMPDSKLSVG